MARWKRGLLKTLKVVAVVLLATGIPWLICDIKWGGDLRREYAALRAQGAPLTMVEAAPKPVPPERNAATLYMPLLGISFDPEMRLRQPTGLADRLSRLGLPLYLKTGDWGCAEAVRPVLQTPECRAALAELWAASLRPECVFPVRWDQSPVPFPHLGQLRLPVELCAAKAMLEAKAGNMTAAVEWLGVCYRISGQVMDEPDLPALKSGYGLLALTAKAVRAVCDLGPVTPEVARALQEHLDRVPLRQCFRQAAIGERAGGLDAFRGFGRGSYSDWNMHIDWFYGSPPPCFFSVTGLGVARPYRELEERNYLRDMNRQIELRQQPWRLTACESKGPPTSVGRVVSSLFVPEVADASSWRDLEEARLEVLRAGLRLKLHRRSHGSYPAHLGALGPDVPKDVFSGQPLVYRRAGAGFVIYSLGQNLRDDGGKDSHLPDEGDIVWKCAR